MNASYKAIHEQYIFWLDTKGINAVHQITNRNLTAFFECQETRPNKKSSGARLSPARLNDYCFAVDKLMEFLHQMGADGAPSPQNRRKIIDQNERIRKIEPFTIDEIKTLQANIENIYPDSSYKHRERKQYQLKLIFTVHYACGLRLSEGANLTAKDIDFNRRTLFVRQSYQKGCPGDRTVLK